MSWLVLQVISLYNFKTLEIKEHLSVAASDSSLLLRKKNSKLLWMGASG